MSHPTVQPRTYFIVYAALLFLTFSTYGIATQLHLGGWEIPVALGIAVCKTLLVGLFFMHLMHAGKLIWLILGAGVLFLAILMSLTLGDYWTRGLMPTGGPGGW
jgi:cytochrome c oxidase subunit 4